MMQEVVECLVKDGLPVTMQKTDHGVCYFIPLASGKPVKLIPASAEQKRDGVEFLLATEGHHLPDYPGMEPYKVRCGDDICDALSGWCQPSDLKHLAWQNLMEDYRQPPLSGPR
ncbi:hypothetical protein [Sulfitobacter sp. R18_1]|uniref:hypothetical protein n=1 Tax=Sulfitobacter sp. R18_1 TaxID=2821104 RepID=UPI001ADBA29E|nr:hypothetical protein [Sulfitobacter sp. R18_1]MBO9428132.1 hypothetical protein [Sulfitobacter sp. R18_1]